MIVTLLAQTGKLKHRGVQRPAHGQTAIKWWGLLTLASHFGHGGGSPTWPHQISLDGRQASREAGETKAGLHSPTSIQKGGVVWK